MKRRHDGANSRWTDTLAGRITLVMMGVFLAFAATLGVVWYVVTVGWLSSAAKEKLDALADARAAAVDEQVAKYRDNLASLAEPDLGDLVRTLVWPDQELTQDERDALTAEMVRHLRASQMDGPAMVINTEGRVLVASRQLTGQDTLRAETAREGMRRTVISRPFRVGGAWYVDLARPVVDDRGQTRAVVGLRRSAAPLLTIMGNFRGLGETGETVLGRRHGDSIEFLAPLRFAPDPSQVGPLPAMGSMAAPMIAATTGQTGQSTALDYRGAEVLANYRPVSGTSWGVVVKQDMAEILEGARRTRLALLLALVGLLGAAMAGVFPLVQSAVQPLRNLEQATLRVAAGHLEVEVPVAGTGEMRALGNAFNSMVHTLAASRAESLRRQEEMENFTYVVSHDLKAPLRGVNNLSEWIEQDAADKLDPKSLEHLRLLRDRVASMNGLIDGLLDLSRVGRMDQPEQLVHVEDVVAHVLDDLPPRDGITVQVHRPLPDVHADPLRLRQVFQNLISNACTHHPGPTGTVEVASREVPGGWEFSVADDGEGIDPRYQERIFGLFQVLRRAPGAESTGVGLAIVKKIVVERGGKIWVESEGVPGKGSVFRFTWPTRTKKEERA